MIWKGPLQDIYQVCLLDFNYFSWINWAIHYFALQKKIGHDKSLLLTQPTVPTHINLQRFIKIWGYQGGGLLKILPIKALKSLKEWTFGPKKWRFIQILLYWWFNQEWRFICVDTVCWMEMSDFWSLAADTWPNPQLDI